MPEEGPALAVLIDTENIGASFASSLLPCLRQYGRPVECRAIGDWRDKRGKQWKRVAQFWPNLQYVQSSVLARTRNAADIRLAIEAIQIHYVSSVDAYAMVTNDHNYVPLIEFLRQDNPEVPVYGFGTKSASKLLASVCSAYHRLQNTVAQENGRNGKHLSEEARLCLLSAVTHHSDGTGWAAMPRVGEFLRKASPEYARNRWGFSSLSKVIAFAGGFEWQPRDQGLYVRAVARRTHDGNDADPLEPWPMIHAANGETAACRS